MHTIPEEVPTKVDTVGSINSLAGASVGEVEVMKMVNANIQQSEGSKPKKPLRGAPPLSLSQPTLSDRSWSSSLSKPRTSLLSLTTTLPSARPLHSAPTSNRVTITTSTKGPPPNNHNHEHQQITLPVNWGRLPISTGWGTNFKQPRFLPHPINSMTALTPSSSSFQLQFPPLESDHPLLLYRAFEFKTLVTSSSNATRESPAPSDILQKSHASPIADSDLMQQDHNSSANMNSTIESILTSTFCPSTEGGYESSLMAQIIQQYKEDSNDDDMSTWQRATTLSAKRTLFGSDIVEQAGLEKSYTLHPVLLDDITQVVNEIQVFLKRVSALIPERNSFFKVDPRDTFMGILRGSSDECQLQAAWMGLNRHLTLAQENLVKYKLQYHSPLQGENIEMPTSPISTDNGIYEALENVGDATSCMRYIYENVPHNQDQIQYPESLRNSSTWSTILSLPDNILRTSQVRLPTITEYYSEEIGQRWEPRREKGKRRIMDKFISPPTSPQILNIGYGTPFKSSSQFFIRPSGIPLPSSETQTQQNVLVGPGLLIHVARGWTWKCAKRETRIKCLRKNPKHLTLTH